MVDAGFHIEKKINAVVECKFQGGGNLSSRLRARPAREGKRLPPPGAGDRTANREYVRQFLPGDCREYGKQCGLSCAERFYYVHLRRPAASNVDEYVAKHALPL